MTRRFSRAAALLLAILLTGARSAAASVTTPPESPASPPAPADPAGTPRRIFFTYEVSWPTIAKSLQAMDFWVPIPSHGGAQTVSDLVFQAPSGSSVTSETDNGNQMYHGASGRRGGVPYNVKIQCVIERKPIQFDDLARRPATPAAEPGNLGRYLAGDRLAPLDGQVRSRAAAVVGSLKSDHEKARAIYDHVVGKMRLSTAARESEDGDLLRVLQTMEGSSLDASTLFVGLARAAGIPARTVLGFLVPAGVPDGYLTRHHTWAEFWLSGFGWVPVDPALAIATPREKDTWFGRLDANRIQISVGRDIVLSPLHAGDPLNYFLYPYAQADGRPLGGSGYRFSFAPAADPPSPAATGGR